MALGRTAAEPGWVDHHHGAQPGHRPAAPRGGQGQQARRGRAAACPRRADRGGSGARRPAAAHVHLLSPVARHRRPGGAHPAAARRPHHGRDRARVPSARTDHGAAAGPGQGQDPRRGYPLPHPGGGRPARPDLGRARRRLPHLQRGLHGEFGRDAGACRPVRRGDQARAAAGRSDAGRAGGARPARPDAAHRVTAGRAHRRGRRARAARRPGPGPLGPRADRRGPGHRAAVPASRPAGSVPDPGGHQRRAQRRAHRGRHGLGPDPATV